MLNIFRHEGKFKTPMTYYYLITRKTKIKKMNKFQYRCGAVRTQTQNTKPTLKDSVKISYKVECTHHTTQQSHS